MARLEINIPIEVIETYIMDMYGSSSPVEIQDIYFDNLSSDLVLNVYIDDEEVDDERKIYNWNVTTTDDFLKAVI